MKPLSSEDLFKQINEIIHGSLTEDFYFDFKRQWYSNEQKGDLVMDILSFANTTYSPVSFILIGVDDAGELVGIDDGVDLRVRNDFVTNVIKSAPFSGEIRPDFYVTSLIVEEKRVDIIVIDSSSKNAPFFLSERYPSSGDFAHSAGIGIYTRNHAENTPRDRNSDRHVVEELWRKHFQEDEQSDPLADISRLLYDVHMWEDNQSEPGFNNLIYYKKNPAYAVLFDRNGGDEDEKCDQTIYQWIQTDPLPHHEKVKIFVWDRLLYSHEMRQLDGGRAVIPVPREEFIDPYSFRVIYSYRYYTKDSIEYSLLFYCLHEHFDSESEEAVRRALTVIDVYEDESEVALVKAYVLDHLADYEAKREAMLKDPEFIGNYHHFGDENETKALREDMVSSMALIEMHKEWKTKT